MTDVNYRCCGNTHRRTIRRYPLSNHLVANCLIFHNVYSLTRILYQAALEGRPLTMLARLSPYLTEHVNRFGDYYLNLDRTTPAPDYHLGVLAVN